MDSFKRQYERTACVVSGGSDVFEDGRSSITQQHKGIDILKEIELFSWIKKKKSITKPLFESL